MMMGRSIKAALIMESLIVTKLCLSKEMEAFIEDKLEITKLTVMVNYRLPNSFIKENGITIFHMAKHEKFTTPTLSMKDNL